MSTKSIVIWGAGRIGRGFVADLFDAAGYGIVLVDQSYDLIAELRAAGRYTVVYAEGDGQHRRRVIADFYALATTQEEEIAQAVTEASALALAVFPQQFAAVARQLLPGLRRRLTTLADPTIDIIICTNLSHAAQQFREALDAALPEDLRQQAERFIGVADSMVMRMVVEPPLAERQQQPLLVWTNGYPQLPVDRQQLKGRQQISGLRLVDNMAAEEARKLYTYNMCHAALAYLGARRGHVRSVTCLADRVVRAQVEGALDEVSRALQAEFGFGRDEMATWIEDMLQQTDNPSLGDLVERHGADPRRKLRRSDRLMGPALLARSHGIRPVHLTRAIAAAFLYRNSADPGAVFVQQRIAEIGIAAAVSELCELRSGEQDLASDILHAYDQLCREASS